MEHEEKYNHLQGMTAVVTGGSGGIGRAICDALGKSGCRVIILYLEHEAAAINTVKKLQENGTDAESFVVDVSHYDEVRETFENIFKKWGKVDILVNCAGITRDRTISKMTVEEWQKVIDVNLTGSFNCSKVVIDSMKNNNFGRIVNIASVVALAGNFGQTNYCASKAGLIGLTKALALETAKYDVTVNALAPGFTDTDMTKKIPEQILAEILKRIPKGRLCRPDEIARAVIFLCSKDSGYITGNVLSINGGYYL